MSPSRKRSKEAARNAFVRPSISTSYTIIAHLLYDAEKNQMETFRSAALLAPEVKELENEREIRRYKRQEITIQAMVQEKSLAEGLSVKKARDILWTFTGRDLYRMFVVEQKWTSETYETWFSH